MPGAIAGTDRFYSKVVIAKSVPSRRRPALTGSGGRGNQQEVGRRIATVRIQVSAPQSGAQPMAAKYSVLHIDCAELGLKIVFAQLAQPLLSLESSRSGQHSGLSTGPEVQGIALAALRRVPGKGRPSLI